MRNSNNFATIDNSLDASETEGLIYMREEEKLAHDVYITLYEQWGVSIFQNIATSEDRHESKIETLLDNYQIYDPAGDNPIGVFVNPDLQELYNTLIAQGSQSLTEALKVGVLIEETDIVDLQERIAQTDNADIQQVYEQLLSGSNNHLIAFNSQLTGETGNTDSSSHSTSQLQTLTTEDPIAGMQSHQMLVDDRQGDFLIGQGGTHYRVRGRDFSGYTANFWSNSLEMNNFQVQTVDRIFPNDNNVTDPTPLMGLGQGTEEIDLSQNRLDLGNCAVQNPGNPLTMQTNDWMAIARSFPRSLMN